MTATDTRAVPAGTWTVDKVHSNVGFAIDYMSGTFTGSFAAIDAAVTEGELKGSAQVASVQVKDPNLEAHLQSPEFFDAERTPLLTFVSQSIVRDGDEVSIDGRITIKGHTEPIEITGGISDPITDPYGGQRFGLDLEGVLARDAFGLNWNNPLPSGEPALANEVRLIADLQLTQQG